MAGTTHYYYDAQGRLLGAFSTGNAQRTSQIDAADNPSFLYLFPTNSPSSTSTLSEFGSLIADQSLTSSDGRFSFVIQENGVASVNEGSTTLWSTASTSKQPGWFSLASDGNLYFYSADDTAIWRTSLSGGTGSNAVLTMQSDGNLVLSWGGTAVWSTGTGGH